MEKRLDVGATLSEVFRVYREQAGVLLPVAFWLYLAAEIIERLTLDKLALFWVGAVVDLTVLFLYQGMVVRLVDNVRGGRRDTSVGDLARSVLPVLGSLIGAGILAVLGVLGGLVLLVVPGLYLLTIWAVIAPVIVVERCRALDAFGRSRQLVRSHGWQVFWVVLVGFGISAFVGTLLTLLVHAISDEEILRAVLSVLAATVTAPIEALVAAVLYYRLLDLQPSPAESPFPR